MDLLQQLRRHAADLPDHLAVRECSTGKTFTYRNLLDAVTTFHEQLRVYPPGTFILQCNNRGEFYIAFFASLLAGHAIFPVACDAVRAEVEQAAARSDAVGIIRGDLHVDLFHSRQSTAAEPALLLQSSGTTGLPKIVRRPADTLDAAARQIVDSLQLSSKDHILACVPLSHSYGIEHGLLAPIYAGASVHLLGGFDIRLSGRELIQSQISVFPAVPSVFEMLIQFEDLHRELNHLRLAYSAGAPLPRSVNDVFRARFGHAIGQIYGASEIGSITFSDPRSVSFDPDSVGRAMPGVEIKTDADNHLLVRAGSVMQGYLDSQRPFTSEGFFPTGDLARVAADGNIFLIGRLKLLIDIGGRKVNPLEVEHALRQHPQVADCVVVSISQTETLRRLKALILPATPASPPSPDELRQFLKDRLSPFKIPRVFECRDSFPRSSAGKILRHSLEQS